MSIILEALHGAMFALCKMFGVLFIGFGSAYFGFLNRTFVPQLSGWVFIYFSVCQVFSNLARQFSYEKLNTYLPIIVWAIFNISVGYLCGYIFCLVAQPRKEYRSTLISATAYANAIGLPIVIFDSLAYSIFQSDTMSGIEVAQQATAMCFVYSVPWNLMMYIIGYPHLLELKRTDVVGNDDPADNPQNPSDGVHLDDLGSPSTPTQIATPSPASRQSDNHYNDNDDQLSDSEVIIQPLGISAGQHVLHLPPVIIEEFDEYAEPASPTKRRVKSTGFENSAYFNGVGDQADQNQPQAEKSPLSEILDRLDTDVDDDPDYPSVPLLACFQGTTDKCTNACGTFLAAFNYYILDRTSPGVQFTVTMIFTNPPTVATLASLIIGLTPPVKNLFFETDTTSTPALYFITKACDFISVASAPISTLITASNIFHSICRNFGPEARSLQRVIDLVAVAQNKIAVEKQQLLEQPPSPQHHCDRSPQTQPQHTLTNSHRGLFPKTNSAFPHTANQLSHNHGISPHQSPRTHGMNGDDMTSSKSSLGHFNKDKSTLQLYQNRVQTNPYVPPLNATDSNVGLSDLDLLNRSYSYLPQTKPLPISQSKVIASPTALCKTPAELEVELIFSKIDPDMPLETDEDGNILPLPRLTWAAMIAFSAIRLICVPLITYGAMLAVEAIGGKFEEWLLPKSALYRCYIIVAAASASADSILMIITKAYRIRQSMMLSLIYVVQYALCFFTLPFWIVLVVTTNSQYNK